MLGIWVRMTLVVDSSLGSEATATTAAAGTGSAANGLTGGSNERFAKSRSDSGRDKKSTIWRDAAQSKSWQRTWNPV
ncbi:hypothetical protein BJ741DRAFT_630670 [Chytriomyces cf. hyalinus JEL632]|nr:hypothetical protein BJ741DRAFT_630670 [Chytriomyces cf. hyalinus JEL632]